jgi:hypothetical protein
MTTRWLCIVVTTFCCLLAVTTSALRGERNDDRPTLPSDHRD